MKKLMEVPYFSLSIFPLVFAFTLIMVACGSGGVMGDGKKSATLNESKQESASMVVTGSENGAQAETHASTNNKIQLKSGEPIKVNSTGTREYNPRDGQKDVAASTSSFKTTGKRTSFALIGS